MSLTSDPKDPKLKEGQKNETGQHEIYLVLSDEERSKGFIRPVRNSYVHVGRKVENKGTIESLEEHLDEGSRKYYGRENGYVAFLKYPESESPLIGRYIKQEELDAFNNKKDRVGGCGTTTTMGSALAETYARDPKFYGATFCCACNKHINVDEFVWEGTNENLGS